jgi:DNA-dependent RNA polymerase auxiliary subunit epsilon
MTRRTEKNKSNYPQAVAVPINATALPSEAMRPPKRENSRSLHVRASNAEKVRELAIMAGTTNTAVIGAMIDFAYERAVIRPRKPEQAQAVSVTFADFGRMD